MGIIAHRFDTKNGRFDFLIAGLMGSQRDESEVMKNAGRNGLTSGWEETSLIAPLLIAIFFIQSGLTKFGIETLFRYLMSMCFIIFRIEESLPLKRAFLIAKKLIYTGCPVTSVMRVT